MKSDDRACRWKSFRQRVEYAPESVYRHRVFGWEYISVHPFADEPEILKKLGLSPKDCQFVDAWWGIEGDATLLQSGTLEGFQSSTPGLFATATSHKGKWVYLSAVLQVPFITRTAFEETMSRFAQAGFPNAPLFQLVQGSAPIQIFSDSNSAA